MIRKLTFYAVVAAISLHTSIKSYGQGTSMNTSGAAPDTSAILDISSTTKGILIPRMTELQRDAINLPANGLMIYQTNGTAGYYFNSGTSLVPAWTMVGGSNWSLSGNAGTSPGTNFIGTTDAQDWMIKTGGSAPGNERLRILSTGAIVLNNTAAISGDVFSVYGNGTPGAINSLGDYSINGYSSGTGIGIYGENTGTGRGVFGNTSAGTGVYGNSVSGAGVYGITSSGNGVVGSSTSTGTGVYGLNDAISIGVEGDVNNAVPVNNSSGLSAGVFGYNNNTVSGSGEAHGVIGYGAASSGLVNGTSGITESVNGFGVYGVNNHASGTGIFGIGNNTAGTYMVNGSGGAFSGTQYGVYALTTSTTAVSRAVYAQVSATTGVGSAGIFSSNSSTTGGAMGVYGQTAASSGSGTGSGVVGANSAPPADASSNIGTVGIIGFSTSALTTAGTLLKAGAYFQNSGGDAYVACNTGNVEYAILGTGTKSTIVQDVNDNAAIMFCTESPEVLFQDMGTAKLVNGKATVELDPTFSRNIAVNENHPLRVFIQLEGDCKGVFVANKTDKAFDVIELDGGTSNVAFTWTVYGNRADNKNSKYQDLRYPTAPRGGINFKPITSTSEPASTREVTPLQIPKPKALSSPTKLTK